LPDLSVGPMGDEVRSSLRRHYVNVLSRLCERAQIYGDAPARRRLLDQLLIVDPANEWAYQQLMALDLHQGKFHSVLKTWDRAERVLPEQLGMKPSATSRQFAISAQRMIADNRDDISQRGHPIPIFPMVGRTDELNQLKQFAFSDDADSAQSVCNVIGPSGIGKTTLVSRFANSVVLDGGSITYFSFSENGDRNANAIVREEILAWAGTTKSGSEILVLDHIDLSVDNPKWVSEILIPLLTPVGSQCRYRVILVGLHVVPGLDVNVLPVKALGSNDLESALTVIPSVEIYMVHRPMALSVGHPKETRAGLQELARYSGGYPLALALAGYRADYRMSGDIVGEPNELFELAEGVPVALPARHQSMSRAMTLTLRDTSPGVASAAMKLFVLPERFSRSEFEAVLAMNGSAPSSRQVTDTLDGLESLGFIQILSRAGELDIGVSELVRRFAAQLAHGSSQYDSLVEQRTRTLSDSLPKHWNNPMHESYVTGQSAAIRIQDLTWPLLADIKRLLPVEFVRIVCHLSPYWAISDQRPVVREWIDRAITEADAHGLATEAGRLRLSAALMSWHRLDANRLENDLHASEVSNVTIDGDPDERLTRFIQSVARHALGQTNRAELLLSSVEPIGPGEPDPVFAHPWSITMDERVDKFALLAQESPVYTLQAIMHKAQIEFEGDCDCASFRNQLQHAFAYASQFLSSEWVGWVCLVAAQWSSRIRAIGDPQLWLRNAKEMFDRTPLPNIAGSMQLIQWHYRILQCNEALSIHPFSALSTKAIKGFDRNQLVMALELGALLLVPHNRIDLISQAVACINALDPRFERIALLKQYQDRCFSVPSVAPIGPVNRPGVVSRILDLQNELRLIYGQSALV